MSSIILQKEMIGMPIARVNTNIKIGKKQMLLMVFLLRDRMCLSQNLRRQTF